MSFALASEFGTVVTVPGAGLEPASPYRTQEPESCVFANFTIWAYVVSTCDIFYICETKKSRNIFESDVNICLLKLTNHGLGVSIRAEK